MAEANTHIHIHEHEHKHTPKRSRCGEGSKHSYTNTRAHKQCNSQNLSSPSVCPAWPVWPLLCVCVSVCVYMYTHHCAYIRQCTAQHRLALSAFNPLCSPQLAHINCRTSIYWRTLDRPARIQCMHAGGEHDKKSVYVAHSFIHSTHMHLYLVKASVSDVWKGSTLTRSTGDVYRSFVRFYFGPYARNALTPERGSNSEM